MFFKNVQYRLAVGAVFFLNLVALIAARTAERHSMTGDLGRFGSIATAGGLTWLVLVGLANFVGTRFHAPEKWNNTAAGIAIPMVVVGFVIAVAAVVAPCFMDTTLEQKIKAVYGAIAVIFLVSLAASFVRGTANDKAAIECVRRQEGC